MALYRYFQPVDALLRPSGPLFASVSPTAIKDANEAVRNTLELSRSTESRGPYAKFTPAQQVPIGEYASMHGNQAAIRHFSKVLGVEIKGSSVQTWKGKYLAEVSRKRKAGDMNDLTVTCLPVKKRGRPLLLGEKLDTGVQSYIRAVREGGGVITTAITMAAATAIVRRADQNLLAEHGGPITITTNWAKSLLYRMNFVKRRGSSTAKMTVKHFETIKEQFLLDVKAVMEMEDIPPELILNWDQTGISIVPGSTWTMEVKGSRRVEIVGISDKRQITAVFCGTMTGKFLPPQLIYQGKTAACLPRYSFPDNWHVTYTPNHWSNEDKMKEYIEHTVVPYVDCTRKELKLPSDHPALAIFDVFKGQQTEDIIKLLEENNIHVVSVPANCTDRLQPMDLSVNKAVKDFMRSKFRDWYATQVQQHLDDGTEVTPVDLRMSIMKLLGACWLVSLYDYLKENNSIIENGFKAAGVLY